MLGFLRTRIGGFNVSLFQFLRASRANLLALDSTCLRLYQTIVLNDGDIEEKFVKGWGKGGQKVNTTSNCVELRHKPTGVIVKCHQSRSLTRNRTIARELLERKLDFLYNGKDSVIGQEIDEKKKRKSDRLRKRKAKEEARKTSEIISDKKDE